MEQEPLFSVEDMLLGRLSRCGAGVIIRDAIAIITGTISTLEASWSKTWEGWTVLVAKLESLGNCDDEGYLKQVMYVFPEYLRRFVSIASAQVDLKGTTDAERLHQLEAFYTIQNGEAWD